MRNNNRLNVLLKKPNNEVYTLMETIENELKYYDFTGKVVYCNCDNPNKSNFFKYFRNNFDSLKIKGIICTFYGEKPYKTEVFKKDGKLIQNITYLKGDGSFNSDECIELLNLCDIVCTNPPFSLFREFIAIMKLYKKEYLLICSMLGLKYTIVFNDIKEGKAFVGHTNPKKYILGNGEFKYVATSWLTTFKVILPPPIDLVEEYSEEKYPKYDNYDIIEVNSYKRIPKNYDGLMGVSAWFMNKYCKDLFKLIKVTNNAKLKGKNLFARIVIKRK